MKQDKQNGTKLKSANVDQMKVFVVTIVLFVIALLIIIGISSAFIYFHWYLKKSNIGVINNNPGTETVIY